MNQRVLLGLMTLSLMLSTARMVMHRSAFRESDCWSVVVLSKLDGRISRRFAWARVHRRQVGAHRIAPHVRSRCSAAAMRAV